ncbi:MAG: hypothetical protein JXQ72_14385 [Anaerolineae bacterium]|nr:hypothetical protein [Anaerolineae bacterium]
MPPDRWPNSIRQINDLPQEDKHAVYSTLLPDIFQDTRAVDIRCPGGSGSVEITVYHVPDAPDPALYLQMGDSFTSQLVVLMVIVNDPDSPRFDIDRDESGHPTQLGTASRNMAEEIRAMQAGLGPGQIRRGLRIFRAALPAFDTFVANMGHDLYFVEPLFYHNAITFERYGLTYMRGLSKMRAIHIDFQPGGKLRARLTGENPFRQPDAWQTVVGRSWAIHDGILGEPFSGVQMYKQVHKHAAVDTFPDARW